MSSTFNHAPSYEPERTVNETTERVRPLREELEGRMAAIAILGGVGFNYERSSANLSPATGDKQSPTKLSIDDSVDTER